MPSNCFDNYNHKKTSHINYTEKIQGETITCNKVLTVYPSYKIKNIVRKITHCN